MRAAVSSAFFFAEVIMNRKDIFNKTFNPDHQEVNRKVAIHEAGHAAAIYLGNKKKKLPPVFFQIFIKPLESDPQPSRLLSKSGHEYIAKIEGGRLIDMLPSSIEEATNEFSLIQKQDYLRSFEADMINILVGPLAQANYIAQRDGELINPRLVNFHALHNYGGTSDLESVNKYLECFIPDAELREQKIMELLLAAFSFIDDKSNWRAIIALANYIVTVSKRVIEYDEIIDVLETASLWMVPKRGRALTDC
jgi:hypothetical protein